MKKHTSEIQITGHNDIPDEITRLMSERNKTRKVFQRTSASEDKNKLIELNEKIKNHLQHHKNETWNKKLKNLNPRDNSLWKVAKSLRKNKKAMTPLQLDNGEEAITDKEKAEALASYFQSIHQEETNTTTEQKRIDSETETLMKKPPAPDEHYLLSIN
jgi:hypothetical protein